MLFEVELIDALFRGALFVLMLVSRFTTEFVS